jgi:hypothetical protein
MMRRASGSDPDGLAARETDLSHGPLAISGARVTTLDLSAQSDQRVGFVGQTRMGKTELAMNMLAEQPRVIVIDSKGRVKIPGFFLTDNPVAALMEDRVIYRPVGGKPPVEWWSEAVETLHEHGGGVIYIDEMAFITDANRIDKGLADAFRLGGELGVGIWFSAQEFTSVHNTTLRQAEMLVMFYNQGASDRDKAAGIVGDMAYVTAYLPKYEFVVFVRGETYDRDAVPVYTLEMT